MNAEFINPFIQGSQRVLDSICGGRPGLGKVFIKKPPFAPQHVAVAISIIGAVKGTAIYTMDTSAGLFLVSRMMGGMSIETLDFMSQSALCELANMISGNVATAFSEKGILIDITPPEFCGNSYPSLVGQAVCIPLLLQDGNVFEVDVCIA